MHRITKPMGVVFSAILFAGSMAGALDHGLVEMNMGANVGKMSILNQDTAMQMLDGLNQRFAQLRRTYSWPDDFGKCKPCETPKPAAPAPTANCAVAPAEPAEPAEAIVSTPATDAFCEPCGGIGLEANASLALLTPEDYYNRIWAAGIGQWHNALTKGDIMGYTYRAGGAQIGYDRAVGPVTLGMSFGFLSGKYRDRAMQYNNSRVDNYTTSLYALYSHESGFFAALSGNWTYSRNKLKYTTGGMNYREKYHAHTFGGELKAGYDFMTKREQNNFRFTPALGVGLISTRTAKHNAWLEDTRATIVYYGRQIQTTGYVPVRLEAEYIRSFAHGGALGLGVNAGYTYLMNDKAANGNMITPANLFQSTTGRTRGHHMVNVGGSIKYANDRFEAGANYDYIHRSKTHAHRAYGFVGVKF